jgi:uncharacterized protein (TIGR02266 family)
MDEKRKHQRNRKKLKSEVYLPDGMTFSSTVDLSEGGIFISTPEPTKPGTEVELSLYIPGEEPLQIKGVIRWAREIESGKERVGMGIEFVTLSDREKESLKKLR